MATTAAIKVKTELPTGKTVSNTYATGKVDAAISDANFKKFVAGVDALQQGTAVNGYLVTTREVELD